MSDLISRQAAIDAVHTEFDDCLVWDESGEHTANEVERILDRVPSAQSNVHDFPKDADCISRAEAIEAFDKQTWSNIDIPICKGIRSAVKKTIEQLPPVQPEHKIHFADADHVWIDGKQYISLGRFQEAVVEAQPERKKDAIQKFHDYQIKWLKSHYDIELDTQLEEMIVRFLHDTANCYMMGVEHEVHRNI